MSDNFFNFYNFIKKHMEFFIIKDNIQRGPYSMEQLAGMGLTSETLVWREGMGLWKPAWQVDELRGLLGGKPDGTAAPPPVPPAEDAAGHDEVPADELADVAAQPGKHSRRRAAKWLAAAAVVFFVLLITCPGEEKHRQTVVDEIAEAALKDNIWQAGDDGLLGAFGETLGNMLVAQFADAVVGQFMRVDNYVVFSVGRIRYGGETKTVSFGILGHVFTFDADDIGKTMKKQKPLPDTMAV